MKQVSEEEEYVVEFEERPGRWSPIAGAIYKSRDRAEKRSKKEAKAMDVKTRVSPRPPIWSEWNFRKLASRMGGTAPAAREMKSRGESGAIAAWAIYKQHVKNLVRLACGAGPGGEFAREPAFRTTLISDLEAVGEKELIEQIEGLWRKHPKGIPRSEALDLQDDWDEGLERRVGRRIPRTPDDLTREEIEESKRLAKEMYEVKGKRSPEEKLSDLEEMKRELERKIERLKREGK